MCQFAAAAGYEGLEINGFRPHPHHRDYTDYAKTESEDARQNPDAATHHNGEYVLEVLQPLCRNALAGE